ncbi:MAG: thioredoxin domain-containing protein [Proteobacteria bacterium]|nr:thioredoxin domain-containing protein [Pseudomonadota bacterium]
MNRLAEETSPYLLQHKDNPVHWQPWGSETLARAKAEDKPIMLSIGYAACHWCHVMAHESFEDVAIARVMNELFINIKVDREERPDLDAIYQSALAIMGQQGGWPLTMFLTPEGVPFWGGTYFPPTPRFGRPAFPEILKGIAEAYRTQNDKVLENARALRQAMAELSRPKGSGGLTMELVDATAKLVLRMIDPVDGGLGGAPKFPQARLYEFLWRAYARTGSEQFANAVTLTLDRICQGGIYDHLGGGIARYSTDAQWLVPHFEKMLYDNALFIELLSEVWRETGSELYAVRVRETVDWVLGDMRVEGSGAFASAYDADSEGEEGRYYVWTEDEVDSLLGADSPVFKKAYDVTPAGNWEGRCILNRRGGLFDRDLEDRLARCRAKLLEARAKRVAPAWDDKVLADWNGLMIAALARAGSIFDQPPWVDAAEAAFAFVRDHMTEDGRLRHSWRANRLRHAAVLDDYANMGRAALALHESTGRPEYLEQARAWADDVHAHYRDDGGGGYFLAADDAECVIVRSKSITDAAMPPGNGTMVEVLARLYHLTGEETYGQRARDLIEALAGDKPEDLFNLPTLLHGFELLERAVQIVVVGEEGEEDTRALVRAALSSGPLNRVLSRITPGTALPPGHPASGKGLVDGRPAAYVCVGTVCGLPLTDPEALARELSEA